MNAPVAISLVSAALALAAALLARRISRARALADLRAELLRDVEARTRELATALDALHQSERLAALGQFASGLAHEVNSPAAVVTANLRYLEEGLRAGALPADAHEATNDALASMQRINVLIRKLLDAVRVASASAASTNTPGDGSEPTPTETARPRPTGGHAG